jgi:hypothetical protein
MRDPLKDFIDAYRPELDTVEPSAQLWTKIEMTMNAAPAITAKSFSWLKYFAFGASAVTIILTYSFFKPASSRAESSAAVKEENHPAPAVVNTAPAASPNNDPVNTAALPAVYQKGKTAEPALPVIEQPTAAALPPAAPSSVSQAEEHTPVAASSSPHDHHFKTLREGASIEVDTIFSGITRLDICCSSADVNVQSHRSSDLRLKSTLSWKGKGAHVTKQHFTLGLERKDTVLYVTVSLESERKNENRNSVFIGSSITEGNLSFEVPENLNLVLRNQFSDATVSGIHGCVCNATVSSGNITLSDIRSNPRVSATFGDFNAKNITGNLTASVSSGGATIDKLDGNISLSTTFGDQHISHITGTIKASASSGSVTIDGMTGDARVSTTFGNIELKNYKGAPSLTASSGSITGKQVELTGNASMTTTFGDISMNLTNSLDALSFELYTTFGDILIDKDGQRLEGENKYSLHKGSILIKATSSSGSQVYH